VYDNGVAGSMGYSLAPQDQQSGFWKGTIRLTGPGGQTLHGTFAFTSSQRVRASVNRRDGQALIRGWRGVDQLLSFQRGRERIERRS
jgi:hypothetical protein